MSYDKAIIYPNNLFSAHFSYSQTDQQLRDPEYLVDQYNQLVSKHNALIEKTRVLISEKVQPTQYVDSTDPGLQNKLNEAQAKVSVLEATEPNKTEDLKPILVINTLMITMQDFGVNSKNLKPMKKIFSKETKNFYRRTENLRQSQKC